MKTHAERFRHLLEVWGLTQEELGNLCGIKRGTVGTIVNGKTTPDVEALVLLKRNKPALSWDWLLAGVGEPFEGKEMPTTAKPTGRPAPIATEPGQVDFVNKYITRLENDLDAAAEREAYYQARIQELLGKPSGNSEAAGPIPALPPVHGMVPTACKAMPEAKTVDFRAWVAAKERESAEVTPQRIAL